MPAARPSSEQDRLPPGAGETSKLRVAWVLRTQTPGSEASSVREVSDICESRADQAGRLRSPRGSSRGVEVPLLTASMAAKSLSAETFTVSPACRAPWLVRGLGPGHILRIISLTR